MSSRSAANSITRRQLTALIGAAPLAAQVTSSVPPQGSPQPAAPSATPEQKRQKALDDVHHASELLAAIQVPMDVEPAFSFKA